MQNHLDKTNRPIRANRKPARKSNRPRPRRFWPATCLDRKGKVPGAQFSKSTLARFTGANAAGKFRGCAARHAQVLPSIMAQVLSQKYDLSAMVGVMRHLPVDGLHHGVRFPAN